MTNILEIILEAIADDSIEIRKTTPLESTIPDMLSDDYKDRLRAEYKQAVIRSVMLKKQIEEKEKLYDDINTMEEQLKIMNEYIKILRKRVVKEGAFCDE